MENGGIHYDARKSEPNFWLTCLLLDEGAMAPHVDGEKDSLWHNVSGKGSTSEILEALAAFNAEGRNLEAHAYAADVPNVCLAVR